ncbi:MAG: hypothetical protein IMF12_09705, partial [Proteobacteria bacterium]|nr:hypothetical protein [Pseudomonadota bacterium]
DVTLNAKTILFTTAGSQFNGISTGITINTLGKKDDAGRGGNLLINAENLTLQDYAEFAIATHGKAQGGNTTLKVNSLLLLKNSMIIAFTTSVGDSGTITANITDHLNTQTGAIYNLAVPGSEGNAGKIIINAKNISLEKGSYILANSFGPGRAGDITIHASGTIKIFGPDTNSGWASSIASSSNLQQQGIKGGDAGNIIIVANKLMMQDGGQITSSSIAPNGVNSGKGGNITINIQDTVEISGVNPHGENEDGFSSGIYARSIGVEDNSDDSGKIYIQAGSLQITDGGMIISSTNNYADSGEIEIVVKDTIDINGDSNSIQLQKPLYSQLRYLSDFSPTDYNQATSGIYASSKSDNAKAGKAGSIRIHADQIILSNKGQISTSTSGGGNAGNISINVNKIQMDTSANISSSSLLENNFATGTLVSKGDIIEVMDVGNQKSGRYVNNGNSRIKITAPVYKVADMQTLNNLSNQYDLIEGQVITVENIGNGESAHFIYVVSNEYKLEKWEQIPDIATTVLETDEVLNKLYFKTYSPDEQLPFKTGERIKVKDMGDGKPADFIFTALNSESGNIRTIALKINQFVFNDIAEMNGITSSLQDYPTALVADSGQEFIYSDGKWQVMDNVHKVNNINAMDNLTFTKVGNIMQGKIYTGEKWIPLNNSEHITVANLDELYQIKAKEGDLIDVDNVNGRHEHFFYADNKWIQQVKGGGAGQIVIIADNIQLNNSRISTESVGAGGGSIEINNNNLVFLNNGKITASVKEGAGDGGNLAISKPKFIINNGQIIAQAFEGNGGNISLASKQIISSPNSIISASSKLGLDGEVNINSPDMDMAGFLVILSDDYVDVSNQIKKPCSMRDSSFFVHKINGSPLTPYDYQPSTYLPETNGEVT